MLISDGSFQQDGGRSDFQHCQAKIGPGGGLHIASGSLRQAVGNLTLTQCEAGAYGGGLAVRQDVWLTNLNVERCQAAEEGLFLASDCTKMHKFPWK